MREGIRLNKYMAERLGMSRREADELIAAGKVTINGETAQIGNKVQPTDKVVCDGKEVPAEVEYVYYAFNKPRGYVCSRNKQGKDPTIYELLPDDMQSLKNVGRLDRESSGIIILTNDGDFGFQMTHPQFVKQKVYQVTLHQPLSDEDRKKITETGVELADGISKFEIEDDMNPPEDDSKRQIRARNRRRHEAFVAASAARKIANKSKKPEDIKKAEELEAKAQAIAENNVKLPDGYHLIVTLTEGRNRQIRRTFANLGYNVLALHRTKFSKYELGDLESGKFRQIEK